MIRWFHDGHADLLYALRTLHRSPGFAVVAILSLALGIGANTLVFSVVNALVLKPLPIAKPERMVFVQTPSVRLRGFVLFVIAFVLIHRARRQQRAVT